MKTKIIKKKKVSRVGRVSRLKNKKRTKLQWNGKGGAVTAPYPSPNNNFTLVTHKKPSKFNKQFVFSLPHSRQSSKSSSQLSRPSSYLSGPSRQSSQSSSYLSGPSRPSSQPSSRPSSYPSQPSSRPSSHPSHPSGPSGTSSRQPLVFSIQRPLGTPEPPEPPLKQELFDLEKETGKLFSIIEIGDGFFQIQYIYTNPLSKKKEKYYFTIELDNLGVDKLQYYIKTKNIISSPTDDKYFLGLNENTLVIKVLNTGGQYRSGSSYDFIDVYENEYINMITYEENIEEMSTHNRLRINVGLINNEYEYKDTSGKKRIHPQIQKDISWLNSTYIDLNENINVGTEIMQKIDYFLKQYKANQITKETKIFTCDDLNVDHTKLIIDEITIGKSEDNTFEEFVIIGYPDKNMKPYIDLYNEHTDVFETIYQDHKANFMQYMAELHNSINENTGKIDLEKVKEEIHKFYDYDSYYKYIENFYENGFSLEDKKNYNNENYPANAEYGIKYDPEFQTKFKDLQKAFYNELASKCLNKPMLKINYVFFIFKKHTDGKYVPAIFNFRELKNKHHPILLRLEYLIKTRLAEIYNILSGTDTDYKLWYSHFNYGDIFHIKTEYIHTMSNIHQQAYKYKNSISLEELIYMVSIPDVDLINLRLDYQKKASEFIQGIKNLRKVLALQDEITIRNKCYIKTPEYTELLIKEVSIDLKGFLHENTKILLMFTETGSIYTIIYKSGIDNNFYKIKLQPNLCSIYVKIFKNLYDTKNSINIFEDLIKEYKGFYTLNTSQLTKPNLDLSKVHSIKDLELYKVLEHRPINPEDYKGIMRYNPLLVRTIKQISNIPVDDNPISKTISVDMFFQSPLVNEIKTKSNYNMIIPHSYFKKPFIIRNSLNSQVYIEQFNIFINKIKSNTNSSIVISHYYSNNDKGNCNDDTINKTLNKDFEFTLLNFNHNAIKFNRIFFNYRNCRYNFIEICEETKSVVWVIPLNATYDENIKEINNKKNNKDEFFIDNSLIPDFLGNFLYLNKNHIYMLEMLIELFNNNKNECVINTSSIRSVQFCLHIQILKKKMYKQTFAPLEQGLRLDKFISINKIINLLKLGKKHNYEYYNNYKCELIIFDK